ncbi:hypothetical protein OEZ86_002987 [Tetradesmus obliquus]|nr:hypothetical protein OEZ86_002987 [Tetradesmus obliquus]
MSQHWIYINSPGYRRFVEATKSKRWLLWGTTLALGGLGTLAANVVMNTTNPNMAEEGYKSKDAELAKLPMHAQVTARAQRDQLRAMILDVTEGRDKARYKDLLDGKIHGTSHGTSMRDPSKQITQHSGVQGLLDSMQAVKLRDALDVTADKQPFMSYRELLDFIMKNGAADTEEEAHARADALVHAGVVLRFNGIVYLKPQEVSELVYRTLPTDPAQARRNLSAIEQELTLMHKEHKQLRSTAKRWPRFWLWAGFGVLSFQLTAFIYLTYWELSWDVMEPIGYMLSLTYSLLAYFYFLVTRGNYFDYGPFEEYWTQQQLEKRMAEKGFDLDRYQHLMRTRDRYRRYLAAQEDALATESAEGAAAGSGVFLGFKPKTS